MLDRDGRRARPSAAARRRCSASATRRRSWRGGSSRRRWSSRIGATQWRRAGERICGDGAGGAGVYVLRDEAGARCIRRQGRSTCGGGCARTFAAGAGAASKRRLRAGRRRRVARGRLRARGAAARSGAHRGAAAGRRTCRSAARRSRRARFRPRLVADVIVVVPSVEDDSAELDRRARGRRLDDPADAAQRRRSRRPCATRLTRFFHSPLRRATRRRALAPIVFSWLAGRGAIRDADRSARRADRRATLRVASRGAAGGRAPVYRTDR